VACQQGGRVTRKGPPGRRLPPSNLRRPKETSQPKPPPRKQASGKRFPVKAVASKTPARQGGCPFLPPAAASQQAGQAPPNTVDSGRCRDGDHRKRSRWGQGPWRAAKVGTKGVHRGFDRGPITLHGESAVIRLLRRRRRDRAGAQDSPTLLLLKELGTSRARNRRYLPRM